MLLQAYPFVARKVLRDDGSGTAALLRDLVYDENGSLRPGRLSALLQVRLVDVLFCFRCSARHLSAPALHAASTVPMRQLAQWYVVRAWLLLVT